MKSIGKKLLRFLYSPKNERLVLIGMPCLAVFLATLILAPEIIAVSGEIETKESEALGAAVIDNASYELPKAVSEESVSAAPSAEAPAEAPAVSNITAPDKANIYLSSYSTERDLYILVRDENGVPIRTGEFVFDIGYPDGSHCVFPCDDDGGCYIVDLEGGTYSVDMIESGSYACAESIECDVQSELRYEIIEDIEDIVEITEDVAIESEIKTGSSEAPEAVAPEEIFTPDDDFVSAMSDNVPLLDSNGFQIYKYSFETGENGCLLYSDGTESDIFPNVEQTERGEALVCGLKYDESISAYVTVDLFNYDNTPVIDYMITAEPVYNSVSSPVGWQNINGKIYYYDNAGNPVYGLKRIDGELQYFNQYGEKAEQIGIDVSFYNGTINWPAVKNAGIDFVIIRIGGRGWSSGLLYNDSCFYSYIQGAKSAGLKVGVYFYSTAINAREAVEEASVTLERLNGTRLDFPIFIDMEFSGDYPAGRSDNLTPAQRVEIAQAFCETVKSYGYEAGVYAGLNYFYYSFNFASISQYTIWLANYTSENRLPEFPYGYDIWQFTDRAYVNGVSGAVDMNVIF